LGRAHPYPTEHKQGQNHPAFGKASHHRSS
jgi:hypothetical protein